MKSILRTQAAIVLVAASAALGALSHPVHAANRCDRPTIGGEARACAASREGPEALRRFIYRTQMIYGLSYWDFQPPEPLAFATGNGAPRVGTPTVQPARSVAPRAGQ